VGDDRSFSLPLGGRITLPSGWHSQGFFRRLLNRTVGGNAVDFFGPHGSSIKFAIGPIVPEPTVEEQRHELERIARKFGHDVVDVGEIEVAGKQHATITVHVPLVGILKNYSIVFEGLEFLVTAHGDEAVCDRIVKTFSMLRQ